LTYQFFTQPSPGLDSSPPTVPGNLRTTFVGENRVDLAWDASSDPQTGIDHYVVFRNGTVIAGDVTATTFSDTTVVASATYQYEVTAVNGDGFESARSNRLFVGSDATPPTEPTNLSLAILGALEIELSWTPSTDVESGVIEYRVVRDGVPLGTAAGASFRTPLLETSGLHTFEVTAVNGAGQTSTPSSPLLVGRLQDGLAGYAGTTDTWISEDQPSANFGADEEMVVDGDDPSGSSRDTVGLIRWDLSSIPPGSSVLAVAMAVNVTNTTEDTFGIYEVKRSWNEGQASWTNASAGASWQLGGAAGETDRGVAVVGNFGPLSSGPAQLVMLNADGRSVVQAWINGTANFGFAIHDSVSNDGCDITTSEGPTSQRPQLIVAFRPSDFDVTPPTTPENLRLTFTSTARNDLAWDESADPQSGVSEYRVYRNGQFIAATPTTTYSDSDLSAAGAYSYEVSAVNGDGVESSRSASVSTGTDVTRPSRPANLTATIASLTQSDLTWSPSTDLESGVIGYRVYRNGVLIGSPATTAFTASGLSADLSYDFHVTAVNASLLESLPSARLSIAKFKDGVSGYTGTSDTWLTEAEPTVSNGTATTFKIDGDQPIDTGFDTVALVRWNVATIPADGTVLAAALAFNVVNSTVNTYQVYDMRRNWVENEATWTRASATSNWQVGGGRGSQDRGPTPVGTYGPMSNGSDRIVPLNSTGRSVVQSWVAGTAGNFGFAIHDTTSNDGSDVTSREGPANQRPKFVVVYRHTIPCAPGDANDDGFVDRRDLAILTSNYGRTNGATCTSGDFNGDGRVSLADLVALQSRYDMPVVAPSPPSALTASSPESRSVTTAAKSIAGRKLLHVGRTHVDRSVAIPDALPPAATLRAVRMRSMHVDRALIDFSQDEALGAVGNRRRH
jgi:fibronectin type 3 domain-containing protein